MVGLMETRRRIMLNTPHLETLTDSLVSFDTDVPADFKEHKLYIDPIQDLHGYDHPWPAGGGKNLLQLTTDYLKTVNSSGVWSGNVCVINELSFTINTDNAGTVIGITVNGSASDNTSFIIGKRNELLTVGESYTFSGSPTNGTADTYCMRVANPTWTSIIGSRTITMVESTVNNIIIRIGSGVTCNNVIFRPMICISTATDPTTFSPYSNICPISGRTGVEVVRCGKNLLPPLSEDYTVHGITWIINPDGSMSLSGTATYDNSIRDLGRGFFTLPAGTYTTNVNKDGVRVAVWENTSPARQIKNGGGTFTLSERTSVFVRFYVPAGQTVNATIYPQLEEGSIATPYEPYQVEFYDIDFPSEAGTVYGGTLDVKTGVLTVDRAMVSFDGTETWYSSATPMRYLIRVNNVKKSFLSPIKSSHYRWAETGYYRSIKGYAFIDENATFPRISINAGLATVDDFKSFLASEYNKGTPVTFCYELATPITYQLTPHTLKALRGVNNIWSSEYVNTQVRFWTHKKEG